VYRYPAAGTGNAVKSVDDKRFFSNKNVTAMQYGRICRLHKGGATLPSEHNKNIALVITRPFPCFRKKYFLSENGRGVPIENCV